MKNRFIGLAAVCMLVPAMLLAQPAGKKPLVGVWAVKVSPVEQSQLPLLSLAMFSGDGSFTTGVGYKALPSIPVVQDLATELGPGYGRWAATDNAGEFRLTFYSVMKKAGRVNGFQRVQDTLTLSESSDEYTGHAEADFLDTNWNVVFSTSSDVKGTRLETPDPAVPGAQPAEIKGVWETKLLLTGLSAQPILGLLFVGEDGSYTQSVGSEALAIPALQAVANEIGPSFGRMMKTGDREFRLTSYILMFKAGQVTGFQRIQGNANLSESGDEFIGHGRMDVLDANWNGVFSTTSDRKGTRLETPGQD